jgi:hypothetical protein
MPRELITAGAGDEKATHKGGFFVARLLGCYQESAVKGLVL